MQIEQIKEEDHDGERIRKERIERTQEEERNRKKKNNEMEEGKEEK